MRRPARPFIVEIKQKRGTEKAGGSIWGDLDLAAIAAEASEMSETVEVPNRQLIGSNVKPIDIDDTHKLRADAPAKKERALRSKIAKGQTKRVARAAANPPAAVTAEASTARRTRKVYSAQERTQKFDQIEQSIGRGESVRNATKQAGVSEQTYYHWKKAAVPASAGDDLKDLLALEEENKRLKRLLAERLRKENAELKKKLELD